MGLLKTLVIRGHMRCTNNGAPDYESDFVHTFTLIMPDGLWLGGDSSYMVPNLKVASIASEFMNLLQTSINLKINYVHTFDSTNQNLSYTSVTSETVSESHKPRLGEPAASPPDELYREEVETRQLRVALVDIKDDMEARKLTDQTINDELIRNFGDHGYKSFLKSTGTNNSKKNFFIIKFNADENRLNMMMKNKPRFDIQGLKFYFLTRNVYSNAPHRKQTIHNRTENNAQTSPDSKINAEHASNEASGELQTTGAKQPEAVSTSKQYSNTKYKSKKNQNDDMKSNLNETNNNRTNQTKFKKQEEKKFIK